MAVRKQVFDDDDDNAENPKKRSRIAFDVNPALRRRIKMAAARKDLSIGEYLGPILEQNVPDEPATSIRQGHPVTKETIERLKRTRAEIMQERQGRPFTENSTEMLRQEREKRTHYLMGEDVDE